MGRRPESSEYLEELSKYVDLVPAKGNIITIFREQTDEICTFISNLTEEQGDYRYARRNGVSRKWSDIWLIPEESCPTVYCASPEDTTPLPGFEEKDYVLTANFEAHTLKALLAHYHLVRESTLLLMETLPEEAWIRKGTVNEATLSARAQACIMIGHDHHHLNILKERYLG